MYVLYVNFITDAKSIKEYQGLQLQNLNSWQSASMTRSPHLGSENTGKDTILDALHVVCVKVHPGTIKKNKLDPNRRLRRNIAGSVL